MESSDLEKKYNEFFSLSISERAEKDREDEIKSYAKCKIVSGYFVKNPETGKIYISYDEKDKYKD